MKTVTFNPSAINKFNDAEKVHIKVVGDDVFIRPTKRKYVGRIPKNEAVVPLNGSKKIVASLIKKDTGLYHLREAKYGWLRLHPDLDGRKRVKIPSVSIH